MSWAYVILAVACAVYAHDQQPFLKTSVAEEPSWLEKYGPQIDHPFSGPLSFSHIPYARCLEDETAQFDIAVLGMPFDTGVTYRSGARFGPYAIRSGSRRQRAGRAFTMAWNLDPYTEEVKLIDCGDVPINPFDNALAVDQMEVAYSTLLKRPIATPEKANPNLIATQNGHPRIVSLGGDHTIVLPILRSLYKIYGPISVIHFDAHLGLQDLDNDKEVGFQLISTDDIDDLGVNEIIRRIRKRVDPGLAPATGTPEAGGWTTREVKRIIRGLAGLNFVGADVVEVSPSYDHAEITGIAAADIVHDFLSMLLSTEPPKNSREVLQKSLDEL
ncbi:hypothetical protein V5O48_011114 [Marasmius crinis-equi]|uniref:Agmatinase n=1 Tax=Marasmius crinis-equi TaxID=585013 RepID=A0ABR3F6H0_9AGAR